MLRWGQEVCSWTNYILGTDRHLLQNVEVRDTRHNTYHNLVLGFLSGAAPAAHSHYLRKWKLLPMKPPNNLGGVGRLFAELQGSTSKSPQQ